MGTEQAAGVYTDFPWLETLSLLAIIVGIVVGVIWTKRAIKARRIAKQRQAHLATFHAIPVQQATIEGDTPQERHVSLRTTVRQVLFNNLREE